MTKRIITDKESANTCYVLISSWINPFEESNAIAGLSSGRVVPKDLQDDLLHAEDIGAGQLKDFLATRIQSDETKFHDPIRKNKLKTFSCLEANPINITNTITALKSYWETFAKLLVLKEKRGVSMKEILKDELSTFPLSLSTCDGSLRKTVKSKLFQAIQDQIKVLSAPMREIYQPSLTAWCYYKRFCLPWKHLVLCPTISSTRI